ncbi:Aldehyde oxidase [Myotis davidii]|uniref:xanthine dehydrogenase n=1 Tax=Myotis davidii TaxID=225400 RepID=L5MBY0_MYODS|nr:Aldehyde oxidase [Myotis davidii]
MLPHQPATQCGIRACQLRPSMGSGPAICYPGRLGRHCGIGPAICRPGGRPKPASGYPQRGPRLTGCPTQFVLERGDDMLITAGRHPLLGKYKVIKFLVLKSENAYHIPNYRCRGRPCKTNLPSNTAFRGFGFPQVSVVVEAYITAVASQCNLLPEEVKEINMYKGISKTAYKQTFNPETLRRYWNECLEKSSFYARKKDTEGFNKNNYWKKRGLAVVPMKYTIGMPQAYQSQATALVHIYTDGSVLVAHGGCEIGQGLYTKMIQVASRELNIPVSYIHLSETSTVTVPNASLTAASMGTDINGRAVQIAKAYEESISLSTTGYFRGYQTHMDWETEEGEPYPYFVNGAACSEVEVDCLTGAHKLLRTDIFMDAAFSINPALDIGQIEGAFIQGMGLYTIEELKYSPEGVLYSRGPDDYKIPTVTEIPEEFYVTLVRSRNPIAIYSSKGLGEAAMFMGNSVLFAIHDAVAAARRERGLTNTFTLNSPVTPEEIRMACADQFTDMVIERNADPEVTLLTFLRKNWTLLTKVLAMSVFALKQHPREAAIMAATGPPGHLFLDHLPPVGLTGTKYACGRGSCGACTVMVSKCDPVSKKIRHFSITACLMPICSLYGAAVTTVEGVGSIKTKLHPVQERIAKSHGTQCGFCTPGMVMSMYTLLRNHPQPSEEQLMEALGGNLCRCTGYRPILESGKTFCMELNGCQQKGAGGCCLAQGEEDSSSLGRSSDISTELFAKDEFQPLDPTQELIFPPELLRLAENPEERTLTFRGERVTWISPGTLKDLLELKAKHPEAPLVLGNTSLGPAMKSQGHVHPILLSPARISELSMVSTTSEGLSIGAGCSLAQVKDVLAERVSELPEEKTQTYRALLKHLKSLAGQQIRNMASLGGHIISRHCYSDLNPILAVGNATLNLISSALRSSRPGALPSSRSQAVGSLTSPRRARAQRGSVGALPPPTPVPAGMVLLGELVSAFRQAQCQHNAWAHVNAGMRVLLKGGTDTIEDLNIAFGGLGAATVSAHQSCQQLRGRRWNELMLDEACRLLLDEVSLPGSAPGGRVEFKRTLMVSFLFKFYLQVLQTLKPLAERPSAPDGLRYPDVSDPFLSGLEDFSVTVPQGVQRSIDLSKALELPGVVDVITAEDIPGTNGTEDEKLLAVDEVLCVGQIICAVAAETDVQAKRAIEEIKVTYEDLEPVIVTIEDAIKHNSFLCPEKKLEQGNIEEAFEKVDQIVEGSQSPPCHFILVKLSQYLVGFMNNGRIKALDIECFINGGCTLDDSEQVTEFLVLKLENAYKVRNLRFRGRACMTNLPSNTAFRGYGFPQGTLVTESCITAVAAKCGLLPEKVREKNMYKTVDKTIYKQAFSPENLIRCWDECLDKSSFGSRRKQVEAFNKKNYWKKKGLAIIPMKFSVGFGATSYHQAAALVHIYTDGSVLVTHGGNELGQGIHTKMLQVASRELKIPMSYMHICETSTATVPNTIATAASIGSDVNGRAVQNACQILLKRLEPIIKKNPEGSWEDWVKAAFEQRISLSATGYFRGYKAFMDWEKGEGDPFPYYVYGAACSEVEIDCLTGAHKKIRTDIVMDACCSLNPAIDIGQVEGAFIQGMGLYTTEELKYSPEGVLYSRGPDDYKIPTITDVPEEFNVSLLPASQTPLNIYSSKGLGESGMFLGSSVFFAITDAVAAARRERDIAEDFTVKSPATPEWVRMACADRFTEMKPVKSSVADPCPPPLQPHMVPTLPSRSIPATLASSG